MKRRKWLFIPFLNPRDDDGRRQTKTEEREEWRESTMTKEESAAAFASQGELEIRKDYNAPTRWWVVSTLFPLIAGTFGPMASAFNICAVGADWRLIVDKGSTEAEGQPIKDPPWVLAVNATSIAIAISANVALLAHTTNLLRFNIAAPVIIVGWYVSGLLDIALVSAAPQHLPLPDIAAATWSQAYWYAMFSGVLYVLLSTMLVITAHGVWVQRHSRSFKLTTAQRTLMIHTILFLVYVLGSGAVYTRIEGWPFPDAIYFAVVTFFTIGFGDYSPTTHLGRSLLFPMAVGGILFVAIIITNIRALVVESGSIKISTRLLERARCKAIESGRPTEGILKIRGVFQRDISAPTELERREKEFDAMRAVQKAAALNHRSLALGLALISFIVLWFVGALFIWRAELERGGQDWSYFDAMYFVYIAQLTIGYGGYHPQTNIAKPVFVLWAMIALPTMTILVGAIGDLVTDAMNYATLWAAEWGPKVVGASKSIFFRKGMLEKQDTKPHAFEGIADIEAARILPSRVPAEVGDHCALETVEAAYRPLVMLQVARRAFDLQKQNPSRKYSYKEWSWLLKLLGEDESSDAYHRRIGQPLDEGYQAKAPLRQDSHQVWSWLGQESPLMSLEDANEAQWILERLLAVLEDDLRRRGDAIVAQANELPPVPGVFPGGL